MIDQKTSFSIIKRANSFSDAFAGIKYVLKTQHNAWVHLFATAIVITLGVVFKISLSEWCFVVISIGFVLATEAVNTALESITDLVSPDFHPLAKVTKDVSAGAVLLASVSSFIVGLIVFIPKSLGYIYG